jgi:UDP-N-acetylmuramate dehydrogenase
VTPGWREALRAAVRGETIFDAPMAQRTSLRVGGPADLLFRPADAEDLAAALRVLRDRVVPWTAIGGGANTLVGDRGIRGCVFRIGPEFAPEEIDEAEGAGGEVRVTLSAGASTSRIIGVMRERGLWGAEFLSGIPGSAGGAATMNAGTKMGEMKDVVDAVEIATPEGARWLAAAELRYGYRSSHLPADAVITRVRLRLRKGTPAELAAAAERMEKDRDYRKRTQPLTQSNCGSVFRNPPGDFAGRLIEQAGLKGHRIGAASWSEVHANFIVNLGGAKAADVHALIELARERVKGKFGIELEPEVRRVGEF